MSVRCTVQEKRLLQKYFDEINQDTGKYCFMVDDTLKGLDLGAVETLIVWDNLDINRWACMPVLWDRLHTTFGPPLLLALDQCYLPNLFAPEPRDYRCDGHATRHQRQRAIFRLFQYP